MKEKWGAALFGDPCRDCGFSWQLDWAANVAVVVSIPARYRELTVGATGRERHPDLGWDVTSYISHVNDNLRNWAERLVGAIETGNVHVSGYDQDALAIARRYDIIELPGALWSLDRSVGAWTEAIKMAHSRDLVLEHSTRGRMTALDVTQGNAHDAFHHAWDLTRILDWQAQH